MRPTTAIGMKRRLRKVRGKLRRQRALRRLDRDLAAVPEKDLERWLAKAGLGRADLFTDIKGNRRRRPLMGLMLERFGIDPAAASAHHWRDLVQAEKACARCPNVGKCKRWLAWGRQNEAPNVFCPNAGRFLELRRSLDLRAGLQR